MYVKRTQEERFNAKNKQLKEKSEHYTRLDFLKAVAKVAKRIVEKDTKILSINDYRDIAREVYQIDTYIKAVALKRMMTTDIARNMINQELVRLYNQANLSKDRLPELLKKVEKYADEKKDGNLVLKLIDKVEKANNLETNTTKVSETREFKDFSSYRKDAPEKIVKKVETTLSQVQESVSERENTQKNVSNNVTPQDDTKNNVEKEE